MSNLRSLVAEAIGTALLVFLAVGAAVMAVAAKVGITGTSPGTTVTAAALAGGLVLLGILVSVGPMSRTHMSPAVTLALLRRRRMPVESAADAWIGQLLGAVAAGAGLFWFIPWLTQLDGTSARSVTAQASRTLVFQDVAIAAFLSVILLAAPLIGVGIAALIARPRRLVVNDAGPRSTERAAAAVATATVAEPSLPDNTVTPVHILAADGTPSPPPFAPAPWPAPRTPLPVPEPEPEAVIEPTPVVLVPEPVELVPEPVIEPTPVVVEPVVSAPEPVVEPVVVAPEPVVEPVIAPTPAVVPVPVVRTPEPEPVIAPEPEPVIEAERTLEPAATMASASASAEPVDASSGRSPLAFTPTEPTRARAPQSRSTPPVTRVASPFPAAEAPAARRRADPDAARVFAVRRDVPPPRGSVVPAPTSSDGGSGDEPAVPRRRPAAHDAPRREVPEAPEPSRPKRKEPKRDAPKKDARKKDSKKDNAKKKDRKKDKDRRKHKDSAPSSRRPKPGKPKHRTKDRPAKSSSSRVTVHVTVTDREVRGTTKHR